MSSVRTTIMLDPDLTARLKKLAAERGTSFKATVNAAIRAGLDADRPKARRYQEQTRRLGVRPGVDLTKALRLAAEMEDEQSIRELELRK
jgi:predicted transcriptional regulator